MSSFPINNEPCVTRRVDGAQPVTPCVTQPAPKPAQAVLPPAPKRIANPKPVLEQPRCVGQTVCRYDYAGYTELSNQRAAPSASTPTPRPVSKPNPVTLEEHIWALHKSTSEAIAALKTALPDLPPGRLWTQAVEDLESLQKALDESVEASFDDEAPIRLPETKILFARSALERAVEMSNNGLRSPELLAGRKAIADLSRFVASQRHVMLAGR